MKLVDREIPIFIIVLSFLASKISSLLNVHALLACMTAGVAVNNFSNKGRDFIEAIEKGSLPLYVVFFAIAGADLNLGILADTWQFVGALVIGRLIFTWLGTLSGAFLAREKPVVRDNLWMGFVTQAGVTLGMAVIVADTFGTWGTVFKNVIVGTIAVFQLVGPVLFKLSLARAGEIPAGRRGRDTGETA